MDDREKLVELLKTNACPSPFMCDPTCRYYGYGDCFPDRFADHLLSHGVTIREPGEWILVIEPNEDGNAQYMCSRCGWGDTHAPTMEVPYCWKCGAPMKGERK